jgi:hypothetical protein
MDTYTQAENFVGLTEIKNVFIRIPSQEIPTCSGYLEINDQIVYNYERTLDQITRLKQSNYNKEKQERELKLAKLRKISTTNADYYIGIENDIALNNTHSKLDIANNVYDNTHTLEIEEEIKLNTKAYSNYIDMIQDFLKKIDYLYVDNKHILTREIIMTSENYQQYLTKLFKEIIELSLFISNYRMNDEKIQNSMNNTKNEGRLVTNTNKSDNQLERPTKFSKINYFEQHYEFTDDNIIRDKQQLLEKLITMLFVLVKNIKNTYKFLNAIINTYWINTKGDNLIKRIVKKTTEYNTQRKMNQPLLPTGWIERIKFCFITPKVNGKYKSTLEDYFRYISFWFEQNKIINDIRIFNMSINDQNTSNVDYVNFLFGHIITDENQFIEDEFYTSLYNTPYEKIKQN